MKHRPTQLALAISLLGLGLSSPGRALADIEVAQADEATVLPADDGFVALSAILLVEEKGHYLTAPVDESRQADSDVRIVVRDIPRPANIDQVMRSLAAVLMADDADEMTSDALALKSDEVVAAPRPSVAPSSSEPDDERGTAQVAELTMSTESIDQDTLAPPGVVAVADVDLADVDDVEVDAEDVSLASQPAHQDSATLDALSSRSALQPGYVQWRLDANADPVVLKPAARVMLDLTTLRNSGEKPDWQGNYELSAQDPASLVVSSHGDKVLFGLAAILDQGSEQEPVSPSTQQQAPPAAHAPWGGESIAMSADRLNEVRGGFITNSGLQLSFGIERAVYVNGSLVTTTSLNVSNLGSVTAGEIPTATLHNGSLTLIQNGTGNTFVPGTVSSSAISTVIQNTLDNQKIQSVTVLNATVNSMEMMRAINLQTAVRNAVTGSLRP
jgi:hypothetical protein